MRTAWIMGLLCAGLSAQAGEPAPSQMSFGYVDGSDRVTIEIDGEDLEITLNGAAMPEDRFSRKGSTVWCMDPHGRAVAMVTLNEGGGSLRTLTRPPHRLRLGVSLSTPGDALAEHLGLDAEETVYISEVVEGKAADRAGLRKHDVITEIEGEAPATQERLREVLAEKTPGDELRLRVIRRGEDIDTRVELEAEAAPDPSAYLPLLMSGRDAYSDFLGYERFLPGPYFKTGAKSEGQSPLTLFGQAAAKLDGTKSRSPLWLSQNLANKRNLELWNKVGRVNQANRSGFLKQLTQETEDAKAGQSASKLHEQLESVEARLEKLESLLKHLDKKLK